VACSDAEVERLLTDSGLFAFGHSLAARIRQARVDSRTSRWLRPIIGEWARLSLPDRVRMTGFIALVGAVTAIALQATGPAQTRWLGSILPAGTAVAGAIVVAAAGPLARALADKR